MNLNAKLRMWYHLKKQNRNKLLAVTYFNTSRYILTCNRLWSKLMVCLGFLFKTDKFIACSEKSKLFVKLAKIKKKYKLHVPSILDFKDCIEVM